MTTVRIEMLLPLADGTLAPASGLLRFKPTQRREVDGATVLPAAFQVALVAGAAVVDLEPTDATWVWRVDEFFAGIPGRTIYAAIPDTAELSYTDLVAIDPATLAPTPALEPAWAAPIAELAARLTVTPDAANPGFYLIGA